MAATPYRHVLRDFTPIMPTIQPPGINGDADFVRVNVIPFGEALVEATSKRARGRATTTAIALGYKKMCDLFEYLADPSIVSYLSLITIFDSFYTCKGDKPTVQHAFKLIGRRLESEMRNQSFLNSIHCYSPIG